MNFVNEAFKTSSLLFDNTRGRYKNDESKTSSAVVVMLCDKCGVVTEVTNKNESNQMPLFFGHSQNSNPDIETVLFFSIDKAMDALVFAQSLFSKKPRN